MSSRKETDMESKQVVQACSPYVKYVEPLRFKYCSQTSMSLSVGWIEPFGWVELPTPKPEKVTTLVGSQSCKALKDVKDVCF